MGRFRSFVASTPIDNYGHRMGFVIVAAILAMPIPAYILGRRRRVHGLWIVVIPIFGPLAVFLRSVFISDIWVLALFVGGGLVLFSLVGWLMPRRHMRSQWWSLGLVFPLTAIFVYWPYALTASEPTPVPRQEHLRVELKPLKPGKF